MFLISYDINKNVEMFECGQLICFYYYYYYYYHYHYYYYYHYHYHHHHHHNYELPLPPHRDCLTTGQLELRS